MGTHPIFESDFDCLTEQSSPFASMGARGPPNIDGMVSLKVDNLSYRTSTALEAVHAHVDAVVALAPDPEAARVDEAVAAVPADPAHAKPHVAHDHDRQLIVATDPDHQLTKNHAQSRVPKPSEKKEANKLVLFFVLFAKSVFCHHLVAIRCQST